MECVAKISSVCKGLTDQMNRAAQGWHDPIQQIYYSRRLSPVLAAAADYQYAASQYMQLLNEYSQQIANLVGKGPSGSGIGQRERYRQQIDTRVFEYMRSR